MTDAEFRFIKVHDVVDGWITINVDHISEVRRAGGNGIALKMISGSTVLLFKKEAHRALPHLVKP